MSRGASIIGNDEYRSPTENCTSSNFTRNTIPGEHLDNETDRVQLNDRNNNNDNIDKY